MDIRSKIFPKKSRATSFSPHLLPIKTSLQSSDQKSRPASSSVIVFGERCWVKDGNAQKRHQNSLAH
jgi:hypothetical protein